MKILSYPVNEYPFATIVASHFGCNDLQIIHRGVNYPLFSRAEDQSTIFHQRFYSIGSDFYDVYLAFIRKVVRPVFDEGIVYQRVPTFRVHLPGNVSVGEFHRDRDYGHSSTEINLWLPLTEARDTNTVWIESAEGKEDYTPYNLDYGQFLIFNGADLKHGNKINETNLTRMSIDFRVIPVSKYQPTDRRSINTRTRFVIGEYFETL